MVRGLYVLLLLMGLGGCAVAPLAPTAYFPQPGDPRLLAGYYDGSRPDPAAYRFHRRHRHSHARVLHRLD